MVRRAVFVSGLGSAVIIASCGRQVTPSPKGVGANGLSPGFMSVKYTVQSAFNFASNSYVIVFNTANKSATDTVTPVAAATQTGYAGYSMAIAVGTINGTITAQAFSYYRPTDSSQIPVLYPIQPTPTQLSFNVNSNGQGNQFEVIFDRIIAEFNASATTAPTNSPTASPNPSASPTAVPSGVQVTQYWTYNFFIISGTMTGGQSAGNATVLDSLGQGGGTDATYTDNQVLNVDSTFDYPIYPASGNPYNNSDAITSGEIANNAGMSPSPSASASTSPTASATATT